MIGLSELTQIEWRNLWWLLLALQPLVLALLARRGRQRTLNYADASLRPWVVRNVTHATGRRWSAALNTAAWILLACAAAGPRLPLITPTPDGGIARVHDIDIIVVLDVSPSMQATDVSPQRLQRAKLELTDFMHRLQGERISLLAFSATAGVLTPPTNDYNVLAHALALADPGLFKTPGSNLAAALQLALEQLPPQLTRGTAVLLVTDGEADALRGELGIAAERAAQALRARGVNVSVLLTASRAGATLSPADANGLVLPPITSRPDESAFRSLVAGSGGQLEFVSDGDVDWRALYDHGLLQIPGAAPAAARIEAWHELFSFALAPALLFFALAQWPRRAVAAPVVVSIAAIAMALVLVPLPAVADETEAFTAYLGRDYTLAQLLYREQRGYAARLGEGAAAYRRERFAEAIEQFSAALLNAATLEQRADALFNLGNAFFRSSDFTAAADAFSGTLDLRPDDTKARANLQRALAQLRARSVADRVNSGVPRRRALALGEAPLGENDNGTRPDFDTQRALPGAPQRRDDEANAASATTATEAGNARSAQLDSEHDYRAALKKLEWVDDHPATILKELILLDTPRDRIPPKDLSPW